MSNITILGAGLAGLIAAAKFPNATILEAGPDITEHKALLRFRSPDIGELTGIPFKEVTVQKDVVEFMHGASLPRPLPVQARNHYALKVSDGLSARSIGNLEESTRYIAPDDFHRQLAERFRDRIVFNRPFRLSDIENSDGPIISTIPLTAMASIVGLDCNFPAMYDNKTEKAIYVRRCKLNLPLVDVFQTIYYPNPNIEIYRASITNGVLIIESTDDEILQDYSSMSRVLASFGLHIDAIDVDDVDITEQKRGKIIPLDKRTRQATLYRLTRDFGIFSVGRFACWRNILLDDVLHDLEKVSDLINASEYDRLIRKK